MRTEAPSAFAIEKALAHWNDAKQTLLAAGSLNSDDPLAKADAEIDSIMTQLARAIVDDGDMISACEARMVQVEVRMARYKAHKDAKRRLLMQLMDVLGKRKHAAGDCEVYFQATRPGVVITDEAKIPAEYKKTETVTKLDKRAIGVDLGQGVVIEGAELSNGGVTLVVRSA
jgi:hypothetical protein